MSGTGNVQQRKLAVITGAAGGMGRACARRFGETQDLILMDFDARRLDELASLLEDEGYNIAGCIAGDIADDAVFASLDNLLDGRQLGALIHTAGLSPSMAPWQVGLRVNLIATAKLLQCVEPYLSSGTVAILVASMAGHMAPNDPAIDALMTDPLAPDFSERMHAHLTSLADPGDLMGLASPCYALSKRGVILMCEQRAAAWAHRGARIVSISPGTMATPMGRAAARDHPQAAATVAATPVGRWGTAMDIANAAMFLASDAAAFITGCDLRVDGGVTAALRHRNG